MIKFGISRQYCSKQIGKYRIVQRIGEGRYGVCFLAEDEEGRRLILKKLKPRFFKWSKDSDTLEIKILSRLCHPGIPKLLGIVNEKDFYGLVLELKYGDTLETMLFKHKRRFSNFEIFNIGQQLIEIVKYLHEKGIVHRDIRIPNVLFNEDMVSLIDFGLAGWEDQRYYVWDIDFAFLGDLLLYLLYSTHKKESYKNRPWYEELPLTLAQRIFLKRLLKLAEPYRNINDIAADFREAFAEKNAVLPNELFNKISLSFSDMPESLQGFHY